MQEIDQLPEFKVERLLEAALGRLKAVSLGDSQGTLIESAKKEIQAILAAQLNSEGNRQSDAERVLRLTAKALMSVNSRNVESARLALISAADMLREA